MTIPALVSINRETLREKISALTVIVESACVAIENSYQIPMQGLALLYRIESERIMRAPGSRGAHHAYCGGYMDHIIETVQWFDVLYASQSRVKKPTFIREEGHVGILMHDIEKAWKYIDRPDIITKDDRHQFRTELIGKYNIPLTAAIRNAIENAEGEVEYEPGQRKMLPLAAMVHAADVLSARL